MASTAETVVQKECKVKYPPGRKVWQRGMQTIWEVDGAQAKVRSRSPLSFVVVVGAHCDAQLWCQNLCLFGKLFIDHKYVFFDVRAAYFL